MFQIRYALAELRRRLGRTIVTALGLAVGVGLVTGIIGVSQGLSEAQDKVLAPLQSVGTDILVTRTVGATNSSGGTTTSTTQANQNGVPPGGGFFGGGGGGRNQQLNQADQQAILSENSSVVTDLSKLGKPGDKFTHDFFLSATSISFPDDAVTQVSKLNGVQSAVGGLTQLASHQTGTVPQIVATLQTGGDTVQQNVTPPPITPAQREQIRQCIANARTSSGATTTTTPGGTGQRDGQGGPGGGGRGDIDPSVAAKCFPDGQQFVARFTNPLRTIQQAIDPPQTDTTTTSYTAAGVDPSHPDQGLVTKAQLIDGTWLDNNSPTNVLLSTAYANKNNLKVGGTLSINGADYKVVGLVNPTISGEQADVYFTLGKLQELASKQSRVTAVLVKAKSAGDVDNVVNEIKTALPGAQVVTTKDLTDQVTGSLSDAKKLTDRLGGALGAIVLIAAFIIAVLLTLSSISKRVREIGTLRAIGWSKFRVVRQILTETLGIGVLGGILGVGVGAIAVYAVSSFSPKFNATVTGVTDSRYSNLFGQSASAASKTTEVALHAPLHPTTILIAFGFALIGGLLAGAIGGWRAARLSPATALRNVG